MSNHIVLLLALRLVIGTLLASQDNDPHRNTWRIDSGEVPSWVTIVSASSESPIAQSDPCKNWWECGNTHSDTYLFAVGNEENIRVILKFSRNELDQAVARLYVADAGSAPLNFQITDGAVQVLSHGGNPYLTIVASNGNWVGPYGNNYDLEILLDGSYNNGQYGDPNAITDGIADFAISVGNKEPSIPQWQTNTILNDQYTLLERGWPRFIAFLRMENAPDFAVAEPFMPTFPYFGIGELNRNWSLENPLPIFFDIQSMQLVLAPFVGFQNGGMYIVNSISLPPHVNFEAPFAFYNFNKNTRQSHLVVRGSYRPSEANPERELPSPRLSVRYSWKVLDEQRWRYSLQLSDFHVYSNTMRVGPVEFYAPSPKELPGWIISKPWRAVTFVEAVNGFPGSEGNYFYHTASRENWLWLSGHTEQHSGYLDAPLLQESAEPDEFSPRTLPPDFRGEFAYASLKPPILYLSPVDKMLHLVGARQGIWNLGKGEVLRSMDLEGDGVIDAWMRETVSPNLDEESGLPRATRGKISESLFDFGQYILHTEFESLSIVNSPHDQVAFTLPPPTDKESWENYQARLDPYQERRDPTDLRSWLDAFSGARSDVDGVSVANVRAAADGFRFEIALHDGFRVSGEDILELTDLEPGEYLVEHENGRFAVVPLTPPELTLTADSCPGDDAGNTAYCVIIENAGLSDASDVQLVVAADGDGGAPGEMERTSLDVLAGETVHQIVDRPSEFAGRSDVYVWLENAEGERLTEAHRLPSAGHEERKSGRPSLASLQIVSRGQVFAAAALMLSLLVLLAAGARTMLAEGE